MARKNPTLLAKASARSAADARSELISRAARNADGAAVCRADPLADAQAARLVVQAVEEHAAELSRRVCVTPPALRNQRSAPQQTGTPVRNGAQLCRIRPQLSS